MRLHLTPAERARQLVDEGWRSSDERKFVVAQTILQAAVAANPTDPILVTCLGAVLSDRCRWAKAVPFSGQSTIQECIQAEAVSADMGSIL
jgi:hypothetical protein